MKTKFYGAYELDGNISGGFYTDYETWYKDTWCPDTKIIAVIDFSVCGKSYADRKENVRDKAIDFQDLFSEGVSMYGSELAEFESYFAEQGKRFGLLGEFRVKWYMLST